MAPLRQCAGMAGIVLLGLMVGVFVTLQVTNHLRRIAVPVQQEFPAEPRGSNADSAASKVPIENNLNSAGAHRERIRSLERQQALLQGQLDLVSAELEQARLGGGEANQAATAMAQSKSAAVMEIQPGPGPSPRPKPLRAQSEVIVIPARNNNPREKTASAAEISKATVGAATTGGSSRPNEEKQTPLALAPSPPPPPPGTSLLVRRPGSRKSLPSSSLPPPQSSSPPSAVLPSTATVTSTSTGTSTSSASSSGPRGATGTSLRSVGTSTTTTTTTSTASSYASSGASCPYDFKVYVYPLPSSLDSVRLAAEARRNRTLHVCQKCILEQFALEYIIHDFFTQFCGRTFDPEAADFFYLPLIRDAEYRVRMEEKNNPKKRNPSPAEAALLLLMEKNDSSLFKSVLKVSDTYWRRSGGGDHILAMPAPITNLRHESSMRGFFHYMSHLHTPIFLGVEYSISFVQEYPVCATEKNVVVPYPTTDPDLFSGRLHAEHIKRDSLLYYAGGLHGECMEIRRALRQLMINASRIDESPLRGNKQQQDKDKGIGVGKQRVVPSARANMAEREHGFLQATFCPVPVGDSPSSKRMYDVMHFGCIPVIISDDLVYAYSHQTGGVIDPLSFSIQLPQSIVQFPTDVLLKKFGGPKGRKLWGSLPDGESLFGLLQRAAELPAYERGVYVNPLVHILRLVSAENIAKLQRGVSQWSGAYRYYSMNKSMTAVPTAEGKLPDGGAVEMLARELSERKHAPGGLRNLTQRCQEERFRKGHKYLARHPCDKDDHTSLKRRLLAATAATATASGVLGDKEKGAYSDAYPHSSEGVSGGLHVETEVDAVFDLLWPAGAKERERERWSGSGIEPDSCTDYFEPKPKLDATKNRSNCLCGDWEI